MTVIEFDKLITDKIFIVNSVSPTTEKLIYYIASTLVYLVPLFLLYLFFFKKEYVRSVKLLFGTVFSWIILNKLISGYLYGHFGFRDRPFAGGGLKEFFFEQPQKAFPSDHAAALMAVTLLFFYYKWPKYGWWFLAITIITSLARVMMGFHYVGDILGGYAVALITFGIFALIDKPLDKIIRSVYVRLGMTNEKNI